MKTINAFGLFVLLIALTNCRPDEVLPADETGCTVTLLGDKDGFGLGLTEGAPMAIAAGTSLPLDHRANDPSFTDIYPANLGSSSSPSYQIRYDMEFAKPAGGIAHAKLHLTTLGIQDGDNQVYGTETDIKLFLDNEEVLNGFDRVDQFDMINGKWSDFVSSFDIEIPASLLHVLDDGKVSVRWELITVIGAPNMTDGFAIDYCELEICLGKGRMVK